MVGKAFTRPFDHIMMQERSCFFIPNFGLLYPRGIISVLENPTKREA